MVHRMIKLPPIIKIILCIPIALKRSHLHVGIAAIRSKEKSRLQFCYCIYITMYITNILVLNKALHEDISLYHKEINFYYLKINRKLYLRLKYDLHN